MRARGAPGGGGATRPMQGDAHRSSGGPALAQRSVAPSSRAVTVQSLNPMTDRGRQIRSDMEQLMTDHFETGLQQQRGPPDASVVPIRAGVPSSVDHPLSKHTKVLVHAPQSFVSGPKTAEGRVFSASDRNLLCMDVLGTQCVVGSADHGLKVFDITTLKEKRNLYSKKYGHSEWVTSCVYLSDGRILSGAMDSKLCLWHPSALRCDDLLGHTGSISQVDVNDSGIAVSASYDRTLRVWDCNRRTTLATLSGHGNPVMTFAWCGTLVVSGDRKGTVKMWDLETSACVGSFENRGGGQVGAIGNILSEAMGHLCYVGDQAGTLSVFDVRRSGTSPVFREVLHPGGVIGLADSIPAMDRIVTAGADKRMLCLDTRMDLAVVHEWTDHRDFIYALKTHGNLVLSGGGNGWLLVHDAVSGECLYGLGANKAAVRCIVPTNQHIVCAGDDGTAAVYDY